MIRILVAGQEAVARTARAAFVAAEAANDQPTCDLLTQRMQVHEKNAWMLRSLLESGGKSLVRRPPARATYNPARSRRHSRRRLVSGEESARARRASRA